MSAHTTDAHHAFALLAVGKLNAVASLHIAEANIEIMNSCALIGIAVVPVVEHGKEPVWHCELKLSENPIALVLLGEHCLNFTLQSIFVGNLVGSLHNSDVRLHIVVTSRTHKHVVVVVQIHVGNVGVPLLRPFLRDFHIDVLIV